MKEFFSKAKPTILALCLWILINIHYFYWIPFILTFITAPFDTEESLHDALHIIFVEYLPLGISLAFCYILSIVSIFSTGILLCTKRKNWYLILLTILGLISPIVVSIAIGYCVLLSLLSR